MSRSGRIPINVVEQLSEQYRCPMIVLWAIHDARETFTVVTYGKTKALCRHAADMAKKLTRAILQSEVVPAETQPLDMPDQPAIFERRSTND